MALREKILEQEREKKRIADSFNKLPVPTEEPLAAVAGRIEKDREMSLLDRVYGLEGAVSDLEMMVLSFGEEESQRLMRIERMLVELLKQSKT